MSLLDSVWNYFSPTFNKNELKVALKTSVIRMKLHKNKRIENIGREKSSIKSLMSEGKDESARIRVEYVIRDENLIHVYEILEIFCEKLQSRIDLIQISDVCPNDIREAVDTIIYCAALVEIPELLKVKGQFGLRWGVKDVHFIGPIEQGKSEFINLDIKARLAIRAPESSLVLQKLGEITGIPQQVPFLEAPHHFPPPSNFPGGNGGFPVTQNQYPGTTYSNSSSYGNPIPPPSHQMQFPPSFNSSSSMSQFPEPPKQPQYQQQPQQPQFQQQPPPQYQQQPQQPQFQQQPPPQYQQPQFQQQQFQSPFSSNKNTFTFPDPPKGPSHDNQPSHDQFGSSFPQPPSNNFSSSSSSSIFPEPPKSNSSSNANLFPSPPSNNDNNNGPSSSSSINDGGNKNSNDEVSGGGSLETNNSNEFMDLDELTARFEALKKQN